MFKTLEKQDATTGELANDYVEIQKHENDLLDKSEQIRSMATNLQQRQMIGESVGAELGERQKAVEDIENQITACQDARQKILARLERAIPEEKEQRMAAIDAELSELRKKFDDEFEGVLDLYAKAFAMDIETRRIHKPGRPRIEINQRVLGDRFYAYFQNAVLEISERLDGKQPETPIQTKMDKLEAERMRLRREIFRLDSDKAIREALEKAGVRAIQNWDDDNQSSLYSTTSPDAATEIG